MLLPFFISTLSQDAPLISLIQDVDAGRLRATVEKLASFHTRNTLSTGLTEACEWLAAEYRKIPGVEVELMRYTIPQGPRVPEEMQVVQVVATLPGVTDRTVLLGGHIDSLNLSVDAKTGRAAGANDDASGVALGLEVCRQMAKQKWNQTMKFVAFSGEEQGLYGSRALAERATAEGWKLEAVLNSDTVGSSKNNNGQSEPNAVRVFCEEGEDHQSRELGRYIEWVLREGASAGLGGFRAKLVFRRDRFGRGGDHTPFVQQGFSGVRFIEVYEEWAHQHTPDDLVEHMDFEYLAQVTRANLASAMMLASAAPAPERVRIDRRGTYHTRVTWRGEPGAQYVVYWRDTASPTWEHSREVTVSAEENQSVQIEDFNKDDHIFAVGSKGGIPVIAE